MSWAAVAGAAIGVVGGAMNSKNAGSQTSQATIDPRIAPYIYGASGSGGLLGQVNALYNQQSNQGGLNPMQNAGLEMQRQTLMSPQYSAGFGAMRNQGMGLLNQGAAGNPFTGQGGMARGSFGNPPLPQMQSLMQPPAQPMPQPAQQASPQPYVPNSMTIQPVQPGTMQTMSVDYSQPAPMDQTQNLGFTPATQPIQSQITAPAFTPIQQQSPQQSQGLASAINAADLELLKKQQAAAANPPTPPPGMIDKGWGFEPITIS